MNHPWRGIPEETAARFLRMSIDRRNVGSMSVACRSTSETSVSRAPARWAILYVPSSRALGDCPRYSGKRLEILCASPGGLVAGTALRGTGSGRESGCKFFKAGEGLGLGNFVGGWGVMAVPACTFNPSPHFSENRTLSIFFQYLATPLHIFG